MTDEKDDSKDKEPKAPTNKVADMKNKDLAVEVIRLQKELDAAKKKIEDISAERDEANRVITNDIRARKITELTEKSNYTVEDVDDWSIDELDAALKHVLMAKARMMKPIGDMGLAKSPQESMDDLYGSGWLKK